MTRSENVAIFSSGEQFRTEIYDGRRPLLRKVYQLKLMQRTISPYLKLKAQSEHETQHEIAELSETTTHKPRKRDRLKLSNMFSRRWCE